MAAALISDCSGSAQNVQGRPVVGFLGRAELLTPIKNELEKSATMWMVCKERGFGTLSPSGKAAHGDKLLVSQERSE